eukprot:CAMPEP_0196573638 /NCGR_PEP_ID=MMETSP1081-20130531/3504_1 /TAXON_ID=36882 /ORGANISM="Pyramimonas amylifera, Strain CCMP720" /LENGTH=1103 /DNA_ID=CAMNT_0041891419 /DNA_START=306 /DNA_END=3617 /DNA_ORIENTATION=-
MGGGGQSNVTISGSVECTSNPQLAGMFAADSCESVDFSLCIHELFEAQAERTPHLIALQDPKGGLDYTYVQLNEASELLATHLRQFTADGINLFGIYMERSAEYVVALLAIMKAGGAYSPIELAYPAYQVTQVCEDLKAKVILTKKRHSKTLPPGQKTFLMDPSWELDLDSVQSEKYQGPRIETGCTGQDLLCYIVYSSGTTGAPKGISASHRSPVYSYLWRSQFSAYLPGDRVACNVFFVWEVLRPLLFGATSVVVPDEVVFDATAIIGFLDEHNISEMLMTPSLLESILNSCDSLSHNILRQQLRNLKVLWLNGEVVTAALRSRFLASFPDHTRFLNTYSISECGEVACSDLRTDFCPTLTPKFCPVGRLVPFATMHLVQPGTLHAVSLGEVGELLIGGYGVGQGYLNRPDLTAARFFNYNGEQVYRTGDLAQILPDGSLEITGRCDSMVKLRGYSVVLGAVEAAIMKLLGLKSVAVVVQGDDGSIHKRLVAYLVKLDKLSTGADGRLCEWTIDPITGRCPQLSKVLQKEIAHYAIPSVFVELDQLPLMPPPLSKVDLRRLPPPPSLPDQHSLPDGFRLDVGASSVEELQFAIRSSMESALGLPPMSMDADGDFFINGGHSLSSAALAGKLRAMLNVPVSIMMVLENRTPAELAARIRSQVFPELSGVVTSSPHQDMTAILRQDAHLDLIHLDHSIGLSNNPGTLKDARVVFLTGVTGYFGSSLLLKIVSANLGVTVRCLVRGENPQMALEKSLRKFGVWEGNLMRAVKLGYVTTVQGDLSRSGLGLLPNVRAELVDEIDLVFHCAAHVNLMLPYSSLRNANVEGTRAVIQIAAEALAPLHYISTNAVFPWENNGRPWPEDMPLDLIPLEQLHTGYAQTKWVAEQLVWSASTKGLPVAVYRPGNLGGNTENGNFNPSDATMMVLSACARLGTSPEVKGWKVELTPVDFAAESVVTLASHEMTYGHAYNLVNPNHVDVDDVFEVMRDEGYEIIQESKEDWVSRLRTTGYNDANAAVEALLDDKEIFLPCKFSTSLFDYAIKQHSLQRPTLTGSLMLLYVKRMVTTGMIQRIPKNDCNKTINVENREFALAVPCSRNEISQLV